MSWMGFLQEQTGSPSQGFPTTYSPEFTAFAQSLGVRPGQYLEAHFHQPGNYPLPFAYAPGPTSPATPVVTGVSPQETSYALYGHIVPLSCFGVGRIGGEIISGPWVENGLATFCISFGVPADVYGNRFLREIAFDSEVVWENGAFNTEGFTFRFYPGRLDQAIDPIETAHFGADAIAYRPQILIWFDKLPLQGTKFGKIPYVAAKLGDSAGDDVNLGEAFERLAYSPWVGYTSAQFETEGITDGLPNGGMIIAQDTEFLQLIQQFGRFYTTWDILQTDKLRIVDRGFVVTEDITLDKTRLMGTTSSNRSGPDSVKKDLELSTIDPDADYTIVPSVAQRPRDPVAVTTSVGRDSAFLPAIMDSHTRTSLVTFAKYHEEATRKSISGTAMCYGLQIEPGDLVGIANLGDDFTNEVFKIKETLHGVNYAVEFTAESILKCALPAGPDPYWIYVVLLMGYEPGIGITDESPKRHGAGTPLGGYPDSTQFKFGSASLKPGLFYTASADWDLSNSNSDQFTVECWARLDETPTGVQVIVGSSFLEVVWFFGVNPLGGSELRFGFQPVSDGFGGLGHFTNVISSGANLSHSVWYHLAVDKDATGKIRLYKNGVMVGSGTPLDSNIDSSPSFDGLDIGQIGLFGTNDWIGNIDEIRISKGIARYASDGGFPVPTSAYTRGEDL